MTCRFCGTAPTTLVEWRTRDGLTVVDTFGLCATHQDAASNWTGQVRTGAAP